MPSVEIPLPQTDAPQPKCASMPLAIEVCTPAWSQPESIRVHEWDAGLKISVEPRLVELSCEGEDEVCTANLDNAYATIRNLRDQLRDCRSQIGAQVDTGPSLGVLVAIVACIALVAWGRR